MKAGDGGDVLVRVMAVSMSFVTVDVRAGNLLMGELKTTREAALSGEGRKLILDMVNRGLDELLRDGAK